MPCPKMLRDRCNQPGSSPPVPRPFLGQKVAAVTGRTQGGEAGQPQVPGDRKSGGEMPLPLQVGTSDGFGSRKLGPIWSLPTPLRAPNFHYLIRFHLQNTYKSLGLHSIKPQAWDPSELRTLWEDTGWSCTLGADPVCGSKEQASQKSQGQSCPFPAPNRVADDPQTSL